MKAIKLLTVGTLLAASTAMADPFSGFYVGAGPQWLKTHLESSNTSGGITLDMPNGSSSNIGGNIFVGASQHINSFYLAEELGYSTDAKSVSTQGSLTTGGVTTIFTDNVHLSQQWDLGLKLGGFITPNDVVYLHPAVAYSRLITTINTNVSGTDYPMTVNKPVVWGGQIGLGYDHAFTQHFIGQAEVDYTRYQSTDLDGTNPDIGNLLSNNKIYTYSAGLSAIYKF